MLRTAALLGWAIKDDPFHVNAMDHGLSTFKHPTQGLDHDRGWD